MSYTKKLTILSNSLTPVLAAIIIYFLQSTSTIQKEDHDVLVRLDEWRKVSEVRTSRLENKNEDLYERTLDRYKKSDAINDFSIRDRNIENLSNRVSVLEAEM